MAYVELELTQGQWALIDIEDWLKIEQYNWAAWWYPKAKSWYAVARIKTDGKWTALYMHRLIMGLTDKRQVDHFNHNTLDNRKENLRIATNKQNQQNRLGVKGYTWHKQKNKWEAYIYIDYKRVYLGLFDIEDKARQAYLEAREKYGFVNSPGQ